MSQKGMFVRFMSAIKKHFKLNYPFVKEMDTSFDLALPKSASLYLGVSPKYGKHVIIKFFHSPKSWRVGEFSIVVHISTEYRVTENWDALSTQFDSFSDGLYDLPMGATCQIKYWCLKPSMQTDDKYSVYWRPTSYENDENVINEAILDVCSTLEQNLFRKAGFMADEK